MIIKNINSVKVYLFEKLQNENTLVHFTTFKKSFGEDFNLSGENGAEHWKILKKALKLESSRLVLLKQIHSDIVIDIDDKNSGLYCCEGDGLITNRRGILLSVLTADCVPVLIYDPTTKTIGAVHAGWRGTSKRIVAKTINLMKDRYSIDIKKTLACIGPSIGPCCYEVGKDVAEIFYEKSVKQFIKRRDKYSDKYFLDLWEINKQQLIESGLPESNIETAGICTRCRSDIFYSARADGKSVTGRFATGIMLL